MKNLAHSIRELLAETHNSKVPEQLEEAKAKVTFNKQRIYQSKDTDAAVHHVEGDINGKPFHYWASYDHGGSLGAEGTYKHNKISGGELTKISSKYHEKHWTEHKIDTKVRKTDW